MAVVVGAHLVVRDVDARADRDVEHPEAQELPPQVGAVGGHRHPLRAQRLAQLVVVEAVLLLDLLDRGVDLLARDAELQLGRLLQDQLVVDQPLEHLAPQRRRPRRPLVRVGDAVDVGHQRPHPLLDLAGQHQRVADHRGDLLDHARARAAGRASEQRRATASAQSERARSGASRVGWSRRARRRVASPTARRRRACPAAAPPAGADRACPAALRPAGAAAGPVSTTTLARLSSLMSMLLFFFRSSTKVSIALDAQVAEQPLLDLALDLGAAGG